MNGDGGKHMDKLERRAVAMLKRRTERLIEATWRGWNGLPQHPDVNDRGNTKGWQLASRAYLLMFKKLAGLLTRWHEAAANDRHELGVIARGLEKPKIDRERVAAFAAPRVPHVPGKDCDNFWFVCVSVKKLYMDVWEAAWLAYAHYYKPRGIKLNCKHLPPDNRDSWKEHLPELARAGLTSRKIGAMFGVAHTTVINARPDLFRKTVDPVTGKAPDAIERRRRAKLDAKNLR